jgi:hypothetical protein
VHYGFGKTFAMLSRVISVYSSSIILSKTREQTSHWSFPINKPELANQQNKMIDAAKHPHQHEQAPLKWVECLTKTEKIEFPPVPQIHKRSPPQR